MCGRMKKLCLIVRLLIRMRVPCIPESRPWIRLLGLLPLSPLASNPFAFNASAVIWLIREISDPPSQGVVFLSLNIYRYVRSQCESYAGLRFSRPRGLFPPSGGNLSSKRRPNHIVSKISLLISGTTRACALFVCTASSSLFCYILLLLLVSRCLFRVLQHFLFLQYVLELRGPSL